MGETRREEWSEWLLFATSILPAMFSMSDLPAFKVIPFNGWFAISLVGGGIAGALARSNWQRGLISGVLAGVGIFAGMWIYGAVRGIDVRTKPPKFEFVVGAMLGGAPGLILYETWARRDGRRDCEE